MSLLISLIGLLISMLSHTAQAATDEGSALLAEIKEQANALAGHAVAVECCEPGDVSASTFDISTLLTLIQELPAIWADAQPLVTSIEALIAKLFPAPAPAPTK